MNRESLKNLLRAMSWTWLLILGGCVPATRATFTQHFDLGVSSAAVAGESHATIRHAKVLQVSSITVPEWLAGTAMYYRLGYQDDRRIAAYGHSDWIAPPASLLEPIVQRTIAAGGGWQAVVGPRDPAAAAASLRLRLDDFSQAFARPDDSTGVIDATATLIDGHDGSVIAQRHFHVAVAAPTPDAQGGVEALAKASRQFALQVQGWLRATAIPSG